MPLDMPFRFILSHIFSVSVFSLYREKTDESHKHALLSVITTLYVLLRYCSLYHSYSFSNHPPFAKILGPSTQREEAGDQGQT